MSAVLFVMTFFCGAYALASQSYLAREFLVVFRGNEMSLAVLLAGWLFGVGAGARLARLRLWRRVRVAFLINFAIMTWVLLLPVAILAVRLSRKITGVPAGGLAPFWKILVVGLFFVGPVSAFVGFTFVTLCRLRESLLPGAGAVGSVYVAEALGGMAGGALFTFGLAGRAGPFEFTFAACLPAALVVIVFCRTALRRGVLEARSLRVTTTGMVALAILAGGVLAWGRAKAIDRHSNVARMAQITPGVVVASEDSRYQSLAVMLLSGQYTVYGNGEAVTTFPEPLLNELDAVLVLSEAKESGEALVVGGGVEFAVALVKAGARHVDYVDIDPAMIAISMPFQSVETAAALESESIEVHHVDARLFVARAARNGRRYDCIVLRTGEPSSLLLNRFYTRDFMLQARGCLGDGGIVAVPVTLAGSYFGGEVGRYAGDIRATLASVFAETIATPDARSIFLSSPSPGVVTTDTSELARRFNERGLRSSLFPDAFELVFPPGRTEEVNSELASLAGTVDTDSRPTTYAANLTLWARFARSPLGGALAVFAAGPRWLVFACFAVAAALASAAVATTKRAGSAARLAVFFTGWAAMSMSVLLLYAFQVKCGYVYEWIGLLVGAFIAGTALGGMLAVRIAERGGRLVAAETAVVAAPLALAAALYASGGLEATTARWLILMMSAVAGLVTGFEFPAAAAVMTAEGLDAGRAGARLESADHFGACLGALSAGVIVVPALGVTASLILVAAVKMTSLAAVVYAGRE